MEVIRSGAYYGYEISSKDKIILQQLPIKYCRSRFYKGDKSRSLDAKSVGLGLFIVKNIVALHGGEITVDSIYEKYTEFTVKLKIKLIG